MSVVVSAGSVLGLPPLRGNPFDLRPIERIRANELVGREEILITWREHIHSQSPRMVLLVGKRGSGKTSLINAISSQTIDYFVGQYWHNDDPMKRILSEISVHFGGHESPLTMNRTIEQTIETLDSKTGPLPIIAFDYPPDADITSFLSMITPIVKRFRAFVVVSLLESKLSSLEGDIKDQFDTIVELSPLSRPQIQALSDSRLVKAAREKWRIPTHVLDSLYSTTGGNPGGVISTLRDLVDEERGLGSDGALDRLLAWSKISNHESYDQSPSVSSDQTSQFIAQNTDENPGNIERDSLWDHEEGEEQDSQWDHDEGGEQDSQWDHDEGGEKDSQWGHEEEGEKDSQWGHEEGGEQDGLFGQKIDALNPSMPNSANQDFNDYSADQGATDHEKSTAKKEIIGTKVTELPLKKGESDDQIPKTPHMEPIEQENGFMGLRGRSKLASDSMPIGPFDEVILSPETPTKIIQKPPPSPSINLANNSEKNFARAEKSDETKVFSSEGELWTVESEMETTLIRPAEENNQLNHGSDSVEPGDTHAANEDTVEFFTESSPISDTIRSEWEGEGIVDQDHLQSLSDAEALIVSISREREVSPSDPEIQARLEVGRPRLSQIFNSLRRSGILSVRKRGRSRLFKLSDKASDLI